VKITNISFDIQCNKKWHFEDKSVKVNKKQINEESYYNGKSERRKELSLKVRKFES
jgi:hypothetical protein